MRPSDLVDANLETTAAKLAELAESGAVSGEPAGRDAVWRAAQPEPSAAAQPAAHAHRA
jgi:hypothetical protein